MKLSEDTEVTVLLTHRVTTTADETQASPLTPSEYDRVFRWLKENDLRPRHLHEGMHRDRLCTNAQLDPKRIGRLVDRMFAIGVELEAFESRGIRPIGRSDEDYPRRLLQMLGQKAPPVLYVAGNVKVASNDCIAVVGSRNVDAAADSFARTLGSSAAAAGYCVVSGGAAGVDRTAMLAALEADGQTMGIMANGLYGAVVSRHYRRAVADGDALLLSHVSPKSGFNVGHAMSRNKLIYAASVAAVVVRADAGKGGTWAGATENMSAGWAPLFVRASEPLPSGNTELLNRGAIPLTPEDAQAPERLSSLIEDARLQPTESASRDAAPSQPSLFDDAGD